jgi:hypothetical protein
MLEVRGDKGDLHQGRGVGWGREREHVKGERE